MRAASEPPAAPPAAPRAPPPGEQASGTEPAGGRREGKGRTTGAGWARGPCGGSQPPRPWPPRQPHPGRAPCALGPPQSGLSPAFAQTARTKRQAPARPAGGGRGAASGRTAESASSRNRAPLHAPLSAQPGGWTPPSHAWKGSSGPEARFPEEPTEALGRGLGAPPSLLRAGSPLSCSGVTPHLQPHPDAPAHCLYLPISAPPDAMAHSSGWPLV